MDIKLHDSLADSFRWRCKESANSTAIKFLDREQTYAEFDSNSNSSLVQEVNPTPTITNNNNFFILTCYIRINNIFFSRFY